MVSVVHIDVTQTRTGPTTLDVAVAFGATPVPVAEVEFGAM